MPSLREIQFEHEQWIEHNFPNQTMEQALLGMVEEMGEIAHTVLKYQQGIRNIDGESVVSLLEDGVSDWIIFAMDFCDRWGIDLQDALDKTWARVKQRDWVLDPQRGGE